MGKNLGKDHLTEETKMARPDLDKVKRPVEEIEKATEDWTDDERPGTTGDNETGTRPTGPGSNQ